jgi:hypothetical protein
MRWIGKDDTPKLLLEHGGMREIGHVTAWHVGREGDPIRAGPIRSGSDPDQFDVAFLDIGALGGGGRGLEPLDEGAEL